MLALRSSRLLRTSSTFLLRSSRALSTSYPPHEIVPLPALSPTMEFGGIARWTKKVGDPIIAGDILVEVETDKATVDFEAQDDAFLAKILINEGTSDLPVGTPIAVLVEEEEDVAAFVDFVAPSMVVDTPVAAAPVVAAAAAAADGVPSSSLSSHSGRVPRIQFRHGLRSEIDVAMGRSSSAASPVSAAAVSAAAATPEGDARGFTDINLTAMRKIIAARLTESKATIPHYYTRMECNIDRMLEYRKILKIAGVKVSVNDLVIVAAALALRDVPEANSFWDGSSIQQNATVDISVAVATDGGLITPIVKDADRIGLSAVNQNVADLAGRARKGKLAPEEYNGGSFTISNLGMYGISEFTAVINPPQACILAVGGGSPRASVGTSGNDLEKETIMNVTLSADRRVVDDHIAAQYLQVFRTYCEQPSLMAV